MVFIHAMFLVYKLETCKNCKEGKRIIIIIIAVIYIFYLIWYLINSWKLLSGNPQPSPLKKFTPLLLLTPPPKNSKSLSPPLFVNIEDFSAPPIPLQVGERRTLQVIDNIFFSQKLINSCRLVFQVFFQYETREK